MQIKKVKWNNHPILGNLELDFLNPTTGQPSNSIVFAGENGTGKTTILETLSTFLNMGSFEYFDYIEYVVPGNNIKAIQPSTSQGAIKDFFDIMINDVTRTEIRSNKNNRREQIEANNLDIRNYGCVFSKARADYKTQRITGTTTKQLDTDKYDNDSEDDFTSLKQLIVDVQNQDNSDYAELNKSLGVAPKTWPEFYPTSKVFRFKSAFDNFFGRLEYNKVVDRNGEKTILFKKNNKEISIDNLSTGEKQIVFRGIYLLKNSRKLNGAAIMVDEPELSMHPKWQKNVLKYYKDLFTESGSQIVQLFVATHSEYVLGEALSNRTQNLVIVLNDNNGVIQANRIVAPSVLPSITNAETNYLAFDVVSNDYHIELYGWLQDKESKTTVKDCDTYIQSRTPPFNPATHGRTSSNGSTTYNTLSTYIRNAIHHPSSIRTFTEAELRTSIELLIQLCR